MKNYIKEIRIDRDMSLYALAEKAHTTHQQISLLELGKRKLTWEWIVRLANALQCHPMEITEGPLKFEKPIERELVERFRELREPGKQEMFLHMIEAAAKQENPPAGDKKK